jgi:hypothetical protein
MKNIHILPTDKPSRLYLFEERLILGDLVTVVFKNSGAVNQNIYITSDEEIKEGDYVYSTSQDYNIQKVSKGLVKSYQEVEHYKKIILTTDQDLILDGVQAIDDDFLEWFVKNPSCEEVDVENPLIANVSDFGYKIIIPKEEPKKETLEDYDIKDNKIMLLEEDLECVNMYLDDLKLPRTDDKGNEYSIVGRIKILQQEQDKKLYSEEEVELIANEMVNWAIHNIGNPNPQSGKKFDEVVAKFKNK